MSTSRISVYAEPGKYPYTGFVYIWKDVESKKFYIGSHIGHTEDGYIASGKLFKRAYKIRKDSFRRRILEYVCGSLEDIRKVEEKWLSLIPNHLLFGKKYYNQIKSANGIKEYRNPSVKKINSKETRLLIAKANIGLKHADDRINKMREAKKSKNLLWYTDGTIESQYHVDDVPDGYIKGRIPKPFYNNGIENKRFPDGKIPEGFIRGKLKDNLTWFNDGIQNGRYPRAPGPNWVPGRLTLGTKWYNDGKDLCKSFIPGQQPEGWILGGFPRKK